MEILVRIAIVKFMDSKVCNNSIEALGKFFFLLNYSNRKTYQRSFIQTNT